MYNFRYYAIGHSYLKHGPFKGWQTEGAWGMAASEPSKDYFHRFKDILTSNYSCTLEAIAENHAAYERLCVKGVSEEVYRSSESYRHMKETIETFKPNIITVFIGGGNTLANDEESLTRFFDVLYDMISKSKAPEAVVICVSLRKNILNINLPMIKKYGFISADTSFIHEIAGRENPYYAFKDYPEYDEAAANGAVEFRTHPNDLGHLKIAERIYESASEAISGISEDGAVVGGYKSSMMSESVGFKIVTEPDFKVSLEGFNRCDTSDGIMFSSAPGTGASIIADEISLIGYKRLIAELSIDGDISKKELCLELTTDNGTSCKTCAISDNQMRSYSFDLSDVDGKIERFKLYPNMKECLIKVRAIRFEK